MEEGRAACSADREGVECYGRVGEAVRGADFAALGATRLLTGWNDRFLDHSCLVIRTGSLYLHLLVRH